MKRTLIASVVLVALCAVLLAAQAAAPQTGSARAVSFVGALAQALSRGDRDAVADMVRYPAAATVGGIGIPIGSRADLLRLYDGVFSAELRCLVEDSVAQGAGAIRIDGGGATFGNGGIRTQDVGGTLKITHITVPPISASAVPPPAPPRRITVRRGDVQYQDGCTATASTPTSSPHSAAMSCRPGSSSFLAAARRFELSSRRRGRRWVSRARPRHACGVGRFSNRAIITLRLCGWRCTACRRSRIC